ncbi:MAG: sigma-70 family RNA polymerase sigma factor [Planctomycetes bacterium]|nr:sigma-70 family RNA polymerase sigma factor [Planctomycetota bacterium]
MRDNSGFATTFERARQHDGDAFLALMRDVDDTLRRYVQRHMSPALGAVIAVDDVLQDVSLLLFERIDRFPADLDGAEFAAYAMQITKHRLVDLARSQVQCTVDGLGDEPEASASRTGSVTSADDRRKLREAVERLPSDQAAIVRAVVFEGRSVKSAAESCSITEEAVRQRLARARSRLRELFGIDPR